MKKLLLSLGFASLVLMASPVLAKAQDKLDTQLSGCPTANVDSGTDVTLTVTTTPTGLDYQYSVADNSSATGWTQAAAGTPVVISADGGASGNTYTLAAR